ncbi:glycosyltransferase family 4 protein [Acidobacteriota bacterium]
MTGLINNWIRFYSFGPRNTLFLKKILQYRPDIIFAAPLPTFNIYYAWKASKKLKVPLIVNPAYHIHDPCSYDNQIFFKIMRDAHQIAVHSEREKEHITQKIGGDPEKIQIFPPLPIEENDLIPSSGNRPSKGKIKQHTGIKEGHVLLCLGQHGRHKNISGLIKAMDLVWQAVPDTALVIAGGTTAYTPQLKAAALEYEQDSCQKIYFFDNFPESQKKQIYMMADIYVSLSDFESFGIVFVEAMLHNLPVIASVHSIASSIVDEYHTGILVNPHCDAEIAGAVLELLLDGKIRKIYGVNGRKQALKDYSPKEILNRWEKTLNSSW